MVSSNFTLLCRDHAMRYFVETIPARQVAWIIWNNNLRRVTIDEKCGNRFRDALVFDPISETFIKRMDRYLFKIMFKFCMRKGNICPTHFEFTLCISAINSRIKAQELGLELIARLLQSRKMPRRHRYTPKLTWGTSTPMIPSRVAAQRLNRSWFASNDLVVLSIDERNFSSLSQRVRKPCSIFLA